MCPFVCVCVCVCVSMCVLLRHVCPCVCEHIYVAQQPSRALINSVLCLVNHVGLPHASVSEACLTMRTDVPLLQCWAAALLAC